MKRFFLTISSVALLSACAERQGPPAPVTFGKTYGAQRPSQALVSRPKPQETMPSIRTEKIAPPTDISKPVRLKKEKPKKTLSDEISPESPQTLKKQEENKKENIKKSPETLPKEKENRNIIVEEPLEQKKSQDDGSAQGKGSSPRFIRPISGPVIQEFSPEGGNDGINISAPKGTVVKAVEKGIVAYAGNEVQGFGNLILIRHREGWVSIYGHLDNVLVKRGEKVKAAQEIGSVGTSGTIKTPQLHFELRQNSKPVDPNLHLTQD